MNGMTSMPKAWSTIKMDLALDQILGVSPGETSSMPHSPPGTEQDTLSNWPGKVFANRIPDRLYLWSSEHTVLLWQPPAWPSLFLPFSPNVWPRSKLSWREEKPSQEPPQSPLWSLRLCPQQDLCTSRFWGALGWGFIPTTSETQISHRQTHWESEHALATLAEGGSYGPKLWLHCRASKNASSSPPMLSFSLWSSRSAISQITDTCSAHYFLL